MECEIKAINVTALSIHNTNGGTSLAYKNLASVPKNKRVIITGDITWKKNTTGMENESISIYFFKSVGSGAGIKPDGLVTIYSFALYEEPTIFAPYILACENGIS
jgi:hypothetical protein